MKRLAFVLSLGLLFALAGPVTSQAQSVKLGPRATISLGDISDAGGDFGIGANARVGVPGLPVDGDAAFTYYFADDPVTVWSFDINALYPLPLENPAFSPYVGAGIGITGFDSEQTIQSPFGGSRTVGTSTTDTALNLVGGVEFSAGALSPFVEANIGVGGDVDRFGITGGLLYGF
jgi:hypothetical protein